MSKTGLTTKITLLVLATVLGAVLISAAVIDRVSSRVLRENALLRQTSALRDPLNEWSLDMAQLYDNISLIPSLPSFETAIANIGDVEGAQLDLAQYFTSHMTSHTDYLQMRYIDKNGQEIVRVDRRTEDGLIAIIPNDGLQDKKSREYFKNSISLAKDNVYISNIELNREHGEISQPPTPVIRIAAPVFYANGETAGIFIINKNMKPLFDRLAATLALPGDVYVTDRYGRFLMHPDGKTAFDFDYDGDTTLKDTFPKLAALQKNATTDTVTEDGFHTEEENGFYLQ